MAMLLSNNLLNLVDLLNYEGDEKKIIDNSVDYIKNVDKHILDFRKQLTNYYVDVMTLPEDVFKKIEDTKEKLKIKLKDFDEIYGVLIKTNENAICFQTICERNLGALKAEQNASSTRHNKAKEILVEKERDHEAAVTEHAQNVEELKKDAWVIIFCKVIFILIIIAAVFMAIMNLFPQFYIFILSEILMFLTILLACCFPCWILCVFGFCIVRKEQRDYRKAEKITSKKVQKANELTERLKMKHETAAETLNRITQACENQTNKIKVFAELKNILCNIQVYLRKFQIPFDEAVNMFSMQICPPELLLSLAEKDRKRFVKGIIKIFNEVQSICTQYESMKLLHKPLL